MKEFGEDLLEYVTTMVCIVIDGMPMAGIINQASKVQQQFSYL